MKLLRNKKLNRRTVLKGTGAGAGVAIALPMPEIMLTNNGDAMASGEDLPLRFIEVMFGNGVQLAQWEPPNVGAGWDLTPQTQPFAPVKDYVNICTGMRNRFGGNAITHHEGMAVFSGYDFILRPDLPGFASDWGGPTIDQLIADAIAARVELPIHSLQFGLTKFDSPADNGSTAASISAQGTPGSLTIKYPIQNPVQMWESIFGEFTNEVDDSEVRLSVLDAVKEETDRLKLTLGAQDNARLDAHLTSIEELETLIAAIEPTCTTPDEPTHTNSESNGNEDLELTNQIMSDLIVAAFACDMTRVASYMLWSVAAEVVFSEVPGSQTQHNSSHANNTSYHNGIVFGMECVSHLMQQLLAYEEPDGTNLLESSILFMSSELSQGWSHSWQRQPIIVGGTGRGYMRHPGTHYRAIPQNNPNDDQTSAGNTTDILVALLQAFDPEATSVGGGDPYSDTPLTQILS